MNPDPSPAVHRGADGAREIDCSGDTMRFHRDPIAAVDFTDAPVASVRDAAGLTPRSVMRPTSLGAQDVDSCLRPVAAGTSRWGAQCSSQHLHHRLPSGFDVHEGAPAVSVRTLVITALATSCTG